MLFGLNSKIKKARKLIQESKKPVMFFDSDTDGVTSYIQLKKAFPKIKGYPFSHSRRNSEEFFDKFKDNDLVIVFDIPTLSKEFFEKFKDRKIIWSDHHPTNDKKLVRKYKVHHINPLNHSKEDNRPSSYLAYLVSDKESNLFYAAMGSVADFFILDVLEELYNYNRKQFNLLFELDDKTREEIFEFIRKYSFKDKKTREKREYYIRYLCYEADLILYKNLISFIFKIDKERIDEAIDVVLKTNPNNLKAEILAGKKFPFDEYQEIAEEYRNRSKIANSKFKNEKIILYDYRGKHGFTSPLSEEIMHRKDQAQMVAVCFKKTGKPFWQCSLRGRSIQVNKVIDETLKDLNGGGGGHPYAGGMRVHKDDFSVFKDRIQKYQK